MPAIVAGVLSKVGAEIQNVPNIADVRELCSILASLGLEFKLESGILTTQPCGPTQSTIQTELSSRLRGSVYPLAVLACSFTSCEIGEIGGDSIGSRTLEPHARALAGYGVEMRRQANGWRLVGGPARPGEFTLNDRPAGISASCLALLLGAGLEGRSVIHGVSQELEVRDIVECVNALGASASIDEGSIVVKGPLGKERASWAIPADHIYCGTMAIATVMTGGEARLPGGMVNRMPSIFKALNDIGVECSADKAILRLGSHSLKAAAVLTAPSPGFPSDLAPQMAALLTQAHGTSVLTEKINLKRFDHLEGLRLLGADCQADGDQVTITGRSSLKATQVRGAGIRETAALVLASLVADGTTVIEGAESLFRGFEDLPRDLTAMGAVVNATWLPRTH
jgi:UDP-N-acetylglucosamine 1-carboxyvinyltransferase